MSSKVQDALLDFISDNYRIERSNIDIDSSLVDQGVIDSLAFVEIAAFLEKTFGITIAEEQITPENFGSIMKIVAFVQSMR